MRTFAPLVCALLLAACSDTPSAGSGSTSATSSSGATGSSSSSSGSSTSGSSGSLSSSSSSSSSSGSSGSSSGSSASSGSGSSGSGSSGSTGSSGSSGAVDAGPADAGVYTYTLSNNTYWCHVYQSGTLVDLVQSDAGCMTAMPACIGESLPLEPEVHVPEPMRVAYLQEPPPDGPHWGCWAPWNQSHAYDALPAERFVHNSEHSGVILLYACDPDAGLPDGGGCDTLAAPLIAYAQDGGPPAPAGDRRYLVTARPGMAHTYAALAWGWRLEFDDWDAGLVDCFAAAHLGAGPENAGVDPSQSACPQSYAP